MPFTGFWDRWRRRQLQQQGHGSSPSLRETERATRSRRAPGSEQLARAMTSEPPCPTAKPRQQQLCDRAPPQRRG